jgi:hypothetical protein
MKIVWRNPNGLTRKRVPIVNTGRVEAENVVQLFYRCSSGLGVLVTDFELLVNRTGPRRASARKRRDTGSEAESSSVLGDRSSVCSLGRSSPRS